MDIVWNSEAEYEETLCAAIWFQMYSIGIFEQVRCEGGSAPGRARKNFQGFAFGHRRIMLDYFCIPAAPCCKA